MGNRIAPQSPVNFPTTALELLQTVEQAISLFRMVHAQVVQIEAAEATFNNVLSPLALAQGAFSNVSLCCRFLKSASAESELRDAARMAEKLVNDFNIEIYTREDVFQAIDAVAKRSDLDNLDSESRHLLKKKHREYLLNGLGIVDVPSRNRYKDIQRRLSDLSTECTKNFSGETGGLWLTTRELDGVPQDLLSGLVKGDNENLGKVWLTLEMPDYTPAMKYCKNSDVRKRIFLAFENKCRTNAPLVSEIYVLRDEAARLLGYPNHATLKIEDKMAGSPDFVTGFLEDLQMRLTPAARADIERNIAVKATDLKSRGLDDLIDGHLYHWDTSFYDTLEKQIDYSFDQNEAAEYFPLESCLPNMFDTFSKLLSLHFVEVTGQVTAWHEDVKVYQAWNSEDEGGGFLGFLYFDLHPRDFKHNHNSHYSLQLGYSRNDGSRYYPSSALMCNFSKALGDKPSLLKHNECVTLFHELGHGIHSLVSRTRYSTFHGTNVSRDFVEIPSKMLENWYWLPQQLKTISYHYSHLKPEYMTAWKEKAGRRLHISTEILEEPPLQMPDASIRSIVDSRYVNAAIHQLRQVFFALYDMTVHTPASHAEAENMDYQRLYNRLRHEVTMLQGPDENDYTWGNNHGKFSHLWTGYDGGYYGYLLALAYSSDIFQMAFEKDPMDARVGRRYRYTFLEKGGSQPEMQTLEGFLGRKPDNRALIRNLGLEDRNVTASLWKERERHIWK